MARASGAGTKANPWKLKTPSGSSEHEMYKDETADPPAIVCDADGTVEAWGRSPKNPV